MQPECPAHVILFLVRFSLPPGRDSGRTRLSQCAEQTFLAHDPLCPAAADMFTDDLARHHGHTSRSFLISVMIDDPAYLIGRVTILFPLFFQGMAIMLVLQHTVEGGTCYPRSFQERRERAGMGHIV